MKCALHLSSSRLKCIVKEINSQRKKFIVLLRLLELLKIKKNSITALRHKGLRHFLATFKVINSKNGLHHFLMNLKDFNTEKGLRDFLTTLKAFNIQKEHHQFLETLEVFNFAKWLHHILMTLNVFQNCYFLECWWTATFEGLLSYHYFNNSLEWRWVSNFMALGKYFLFGTNFSWNEGSDICVNVEYVLFGHNFDFLGGCLVVTAHYLVGTNGYSTLPGGYCSLPPVTTCSDF